VLQEVETRFGNGRLVALATSGSGTRGSGFWHRKPVRIHRLLIFESAGFESEGRKKRIKVAIANVEVRMNIPLLALFTLKLYQKVFFK
jgi:hypothetical protein